MIIYEFRYGSWGVCFTYGTWFGIKGLVACGMTYENSNSIRKACDFLLSKQLDSGGWGESYLSCQNKVINRILSLLRISNFVIFPGNFEKETVNCIEEKTIMLIVQFLCLNSSCEIFDQVYTNLEGNKSHLVNTAWAMLSLIEAGQVCKLVNIFFN